MKDEFKDKRRIREGFERSREGEPVHNNSKRLPQEEESGRTKGGSRNVAATMFLRGYEDANNEKLEDRLTQWAKENDCLFTLNEIEQEFGEDIFTQIQKSTNGNSPSPGREAIVYRYDDGHLLKVVRYNVFSKNVLEFIDNRIALNNLIEDLHTGNWIKGYNGKMYCIDPAPKLNYSRKYNNI